MAGQDATQEKENYERHERGWIRRLAQEGTQSVLFPKSASIARQHGQVALQGVFEKNPGAWYPDSSKTRGERMEQEQDIHGLG